MTERMVEVEWEDSASTHGWQEVEEFPEPWIIHSIGYVERDDEQGIKLYEARSISQTSDVGHKDPKRRARDYGCATAIPRSAIRHVWELRRKR